MRLFRNLKGHVGALLLIFVLLIGQAVCDLALPTFTSDIVDVGIQQRGIQHATLEEMRAETYEALRELVDPADRAAFEAAYEQGEDGHYRLTQEARASLEELDAIEMRPAALLSVGAGNATGDASMAYAEGEVGGVGDDLSEGIAAQRAIAFAQAEYEACGIDVGAMQIGYLVNTGGLMLLVTLGMVACSVLVGLVASRTGAEIARSLRERLFSKVVSFGAEELNRFSTASLITRSTNDITQVQMVLIMLMRMVLYAPILGIGGVIMISTTNVSMSWIIVLAVALVIGLVATLFGITYPRFRVMQKLIDRVNLVSRESLTGVQVVRAFRHEDIAQDRFDLASGDLMRTQLFTSRAMMFMFPGMTLVMNGASCLIVWTAAQQVDLGMMQVGDMIAFITYAMVIIMSFLMLSSIAIMLPRANVAATRIDEVLQTEPAISDPERPVELRPAVLTGVGGPAGYPVEFDNVTFHYGDAEKAVLHDISFTAQPGKTTAIIGGTGSGKSTLLNLIPRFYDVTAGSVRVAGVDVRDVTQADLRACIGYVPQRSALFSGTIESNLKYAGPDVDDADMREAARIAQASSFVEAHPDGYGREVAQGGTNVSGGQRQRLAIARALAKHAPILLFDDSFSALDYKTDQALRAELSKAAKDATVIIVAQRIATILHADQIVVLDRGRIVGQGTHEELLATCDVYREIAKSQLSPEELGLEGGAR